MHSYTYASAQIMKIMHVCIKGGGQLNVDRRFDSILIVKSTVILRNSCRFVDKFFCLKNL